MGSATGWKANGNPDRYFIEATGGIAYVFRAEP